MRIQLICGVTLAVTVSCNSWAPHRLAQEPAADDPPQSISDANQLNRLSDTEAFWHGTVHFATAQKIPTYLLDWNLKNGTRVVSTDSSGASYHSFSRTIRIPRLNYNPAVRAGHGESVFRADLQPVDLVINEAFHAWFHLAAKRDPACKPFMRLVAEQEQFDYGRRPWELNLPSLEELVEEALSEMISSLSGHISGKALRGAAISIPTYEEAIKIGISLTPEHNGPGERFHQPERLAKAANQRISQGLYDVASTVFESGCRT